MCGVQCSVFPLSVFNKHVLELWCCLFGEDVGLRAGKILPVYVPWCRRASTTKLTIHRLCTWFIWNILKTNCIYSLYVYWLPDGNGSGMCLVVDLRFNVKNHHPGCTGFDIELSGAWFCWRSSNMETVSWFWRASWSFLLSVPEGTWSLWSKSTFFISFLLSVRGPHNKRRQLEA